MRVIAGKYRGKKLFSPPNLDIRPTADRAKEALFSILKSKLAVFENCHFLDVFAGSGAIGIEAISRGFASACLIDVDVKTCQKNAQIFAGENIKLLCCNATNLPLAAQKYDLIFLDAPYSKGLSEKALQSLCDKNWLAPQALCVIEVEKNETLNYGDGFELIDERIYGLAKFIFLQVIA